MEIPETAPMHRILYKKLFNDLNVNGILSWELYEFKTSSVPLVKDADIGDIWYANGRIELVEYKIS